MKIKNPYIKDGVEYKLTLIDCGKYELECYVFAQNSNRPALFISNSDTNMYNIGGDFLSYDWNSKEINENLIPTIDEVLERKWGDEILGNNFTLISAIITPEITYFTSNNNLTEGRKEAQENENMQIDTKILKDIIVKWRDFVKTFED